MVRQRSVMHEALVDAGRKRMRAVGRHRRFRRHPGVADAVGAGHVLERETLGDDARQPDFLVELHPAAGADHANTRAMGGQPVAHFLFGVLRDRQHQVRAALRMAECLPEMLRQVSGNRIDVVAAVRTQRQLDMGVVACGIDGKAGAVRSAVGHHAEHLRQHRAELRLERFGLQETARQFRTCSEAHGSDDDRETLIGPGGTVNS